MLHVSNSRARVLILTFIAIGVPFFVNEFLGESTLRESRWLLLFNPNFWYRQFGPDGPRTTRIDEFRIVTITRNVEPGSALGEFRCTHREFMADLLLKVAAQNPRLIVLDKWYGRIPPGVCTSGLDGNDGTPKLQKAIRTISDKVKLVIAVGAYNHDEIQQFCPDLRSEDLKPEQVVLGEYESLNEGIPDDRVKLALAWIGVDLRQIPLGWMAFGKCTDVGRESPKMWPTIATAASELLDQNIMLTNKLIQRQLEIDPPYTKLLPEGRFESVSAISLLCDKANKYSDWKKCVEDKEEGDKSALAGLNHKIVIIGEEWIDLHKMDETVFTGPHLQANYIASLLDGSILRPASRLTNWLTSAAWLILTFWIFYGWKPASPELAVVVSLAAIFGMGMLLSAVTTRQLGIFTELVPPTILEIIGLYLARKIELLLEQRKKAEGAAGE
jgi:CHASE2 domain-containing sensor protein